MVSSPVPFPFLLVCVCVSVLVCAGMCVSLSLCVCFCACVSLCECVDEWPAGSSKEWLYNPEQVVLVAQQLVTVEAWRAVFFPPLTHTNTWGSMEGKLFRIKTIKNKIPQM